LFIGNRNANDSIPNGIKLS